MNEVSAIKKTYPDILVDIQHRIENLFARLEEPTGREYYIITECWQYIEDLKEKGNGRRGMKMDKEKSAKLREVLKEVRECLEAAIEKAEKETTNWRKELTTIIKGDVLITICKDGVTYQGQTLEAGLKILEHNFDPGYGSYEGDDFIAWSENLVINVENNDGASWLSAISRNPTKTKSKETGYRNERTG